MKGNLMTGPNVPIMRSLTSFLKTLFPEISQDDVQQMIGAHHYFHSMCIESYDSYGMVPDDMK